MSSEPTTAEGDEGVDGVDDSLLPPVVREYPWGGGVAAGAATFVGSYLAFVLTVVATARSVDLSQPVAAVRGIGTLFYNAHFIPSYRQVEIVAQQNGETVRAVSREGVSNDLLALVGESATNVPVVVYFAVPVVVLLVAAAAFSYYALDAGQGDSPRLLALRGLCTGGAFALGYLALALVVTYLVTQQATEGESFRLLHPSRPQTFLFGSLYPAVLGAVGSAVGQALDRRE